MVCGKKTEIVRKGHPSRKNLLEGEDFLIWIEGEFVPASRWSFNNDLE
jgi:hypothetical protein